MSPSSLREFDGRNAPRLQGGRDGGMVDAGALKASW